MIYLDTRAGSASAFAVSPRPGGRGTPQIRLSFRWLPRLGLWGCLPTTPDTFEPIGIFQLVYPGAVMLIDPRILPGRLQWEGPDAYARADLGETLRLRWYSPEEVAAGE